MRLLGDIQQILDELKEQGVIISWVSCTDEPRWANECLDLFESKNGSKLASFVDVSKGKQIFKANKQRHFEKLQKMYPSVSYNEMLFFDNEKINIDRQRYWRKVYIFSQGNNEGGLREWHTTMAKLAEKLMITVVE